MHLLTASFFTLFPFVLQHCVVAARVRRIEERQDLSFCFGANSICEFSNNLWTQCENYPIISAEWYKCVCGNGYVSVDQACTWCQEAYNISYFNDINENEAGCSSAGVPVAPIPSSILSVESSYNQTYTMAPSAVGTATNPVSNGVITSVTTLKGGGQGAPTTTPASAGSPSSTTISTVKAGSGTGAAEGQNSGVALVFSFVALGLLVLNLV